MCTVVGDGSETDPQTRKETMKVATHQPPTFMGISAPQPTRYTLELSKAEQSTIDRANVIAERARDMIRDHIGEQSFDRSDYYTISARDLSAEDGPIRWDEYDRMEDSL